MFNNRYICKYYPHLSLFLIMLLGSPQGWSAEEKPAETASSIKGLWIESRKGNVAVSVMDCDTGLCGRIHWLRKPLAKDGKPKTDHHNPNADLQTRSLCGLAILHGFTSTDASTWRNGKVYNPDDGRTFSGTIKLTRDGSLKVRGYLGISLFGKTVKWERPQQPLPTCEQSDA